MWDVVGVGNLCHNTQVPAFLTHRCACSPPAAACCPPFPLALSGTLALLHTTTPTSLASHNQVLLDLQEECEKYGQVTGVVVPRPADPSTAKQVHGTGNYGKVSARGCWGAVVCVVWEDGRAEA